MCAFCSVGGSGLGCSGVFLVDVQSCKVEKRCYQKGPQQENHFKTGPNPQAIQLRHLLGRGNLHFGIREHAMGSIMSLGIARFIKLHIRFRVGLSGSGVRT